VNISQYKGNKN